MSTGLVDSALAAYREHPEFAPVKHEAFFSAPHDQLDEQLAVLGLLPTGGKTSAVVERIPFQLGSTGVYVGPVRCTHCGSADSMMPGVDRRPFSLWHLGRFLSWEHDCAGEKRSVLASLKEGGPVMSNDVPDQEDLKALKEGLRHFLDGFHRATGWRVEEIAVRDDGEIAVTLGPPATPE